MSQQKGGHKTGTSRNSIRVGNQRWQHRKKGLISPTEYCSSAKEAWETAGLVWVE